MRANDPTAPSNTAALDPGATMRLSTSAVVASKVLKNEIG